MTHNGRAVGEPINVLSESESWRLLASQPVGRLVTSVDGHPEIFPVNFAVQRRTVLIQTAEGTKLVSAVINNRVLFEVDDYDATEGWSVIIKGRARTLRSADELAEAGEAQLRSWTTTVKTHYLRVVPSQITGRRFVFGGAAGD